ncbi:MAG: hypothetical protein WBA97_17450 [Actinophytocola sp.]|uniref:hypothetical protein n=1 Tax=Actinophytocola sp. TaxID=1872138 RepID=UPI003C729693
MSDGEPVRWEARSHEQIYDEVHRPEERRRSHSLAESASMYRDFSADLQEIRSRYSSLARKLIGESAGDGAEAASIAAGIVFRGLTDAHELTNLAGAKRNRLSELNEYLRRQMPEPVGAPENNGFTAHGRAWMDPPDFEAEDNVRHGRGERARDLMRTYERSITAFAGDGKTAPPTFSGPPTAVDRHLDGPTVPLSTARYGSRVSSSGGVDGQPPRPPDGARHWTAAQPQAGPPAQAGYRDFGPSGHLDAENPESRAAGGAMGSPPPPRDHETELSSSRREDNDLFPSGGKASPPVIGL